LPSPEAHPLRELLRAVYGIVPETRGKILKRADALLPIWRKADAALAARKPAEGPVTCDGKGAGEAAALRLAMEQLEDATAAALVPLALARTALRTAARAVDKLNKRFYKKLQAESRDNAALRAGLKQIPAECPHRRPKIRATAAPESSGPSSSESSGAPSGE
jgi:hypothetical protein